MEVEQGGRYETVDSPRSIALVFFTMMWHCGCRRPSCSHTSKGTVRHLAWKGYYTLLNHCWSSEGKKKSTVFVRSTITKCHRAAGAIRYSMTVKLWRWVKMWLDDKYRAGTFFTGWDMKWLRMWWICPVKYSFHTKNVKMLKTPQWLMAFTIKQNTVSISTKRLCCFGSQELLLLCHFQSISVNEA